MTKKAAETKPAPEREQTDESLAKERKNTDQAIAARRSDTQLTADELVDRAREHADDVLETAREKADQKLKEPKVQAVAAVAAERELEDKILDEERAAADEILRREREAQAKTLAKLLPIEREKTDRFLLTERARSDDKLANRDDFMGMVSHDLRNLLSGILLNASSLADNASASEEGKSTLVNVKRIERYVARMNRLIGDLVDVVSIDAGKLAVRRVPGDLAVLVAEAVDIFGQPATERGVTLTAELDGSPLPGSFDHDRMLQVLANLITNAVKFTPPGGAIVVRGERVGNDLGVSVRDTGKGVPREMLESVFERFWQVDKNDQRGMGLGLYISKCIVVAHGGRIWAESKPGEGSVFKVTIPPKAPATAG